MAKKKEDPRGRMPPPLNPKPKKQRGKAKPEAALESGGSKSGARKARGGKHAGDTRPRKPPEPKPAIEPAIDAGGGFRAGWVAIVGRPNVGKSTILNQLLGQKIAATTHKPQTTRRNLLGILHPEGAQILLLDTPGHHAAKGPLNKYMVQQVTEAIRGADVVAYVVEARDDDSITPGNLKVLEAVQSSGKPVAVLINKIDKIKNKNALLNQMQAYAAKLGDQAAAIVPVSAVKRDGLEDAVRAIGAALPEGEPQYEDGQLTDASERAITAEMIREKVMIETQQELPYSAAVTVEAFEDMRPKLVRIIATIHVERDSQKGIVIGKGGERLKAIGQRARHDVELLVGSKVYLDLQVRVTENWSERPRALVELGYGGEGRS